MASRTTNSGIHVLPSWQRSGVEEPAYAVSSFSWAAFQGIISTRTAMPGFLRSNSGISFCTYSPSAPIAQNVMTVFDSSPLRQHSEDSITKTNPITMGILISRTVGKHTREDSTIIFVPRDRYVESTNHRPMNLEPTCPEAESDKRESYPDRPEFP